MTPPTREEMQRLLSEIAGDGHGGMDVTLTQQQCNQVVAYIRTLEREHQAMKEVLEEYSTLPDVACGGVIEALSQPAKAVLSSLTL